MPEITVSRPYCMRRYGSCRYHKVEVYYERDILVDGVKVGAYEGWAAGWSLDWSYLKRGIYVGSLWKPGTLDQYGDDEVPPGMRLPTDAEQSAYRTRFRAMLTKRSAWSNEHPHQAWMREEEAAGRDPYSNFFPAKEPQDER